MREFTHLILTGTKVDSLLTEVFHFATIRAETRIGESVPRVPCFKQTGPSGTGARRGRYTGGEKARAGRFREHERTCRPGLIIY